MLFDSWYDLLRVAVVGVAAYAGLILLLRITGKRTLSKMNAFDLVVTVSLGSTLATVLLLDEVSLSEGLLALGVLCGLQYAVACLSIRSARFQHVVKSEPTLLFYRGRFLREMLRRERVTEAEILAAARAEGKARLSDVAAVVLETDGSFSVISRAGDVAADTLRFVEGADTRT